MPPLGWPPARRPTRFKPWQIAGMGCGGLFGLFLVIGIIGAIVDPHPQGSTNGTSTSHPKPAVAASRSAPQPTISSASPQPAPSSASPAPVNGTSADDTAKAVQYLNEVDNGKHPRTDDQAVVDALLHKCNDNMLVLAFTATNTGLDVVGATGADQDIYAVMHQLDADLPATGSLVQCDTHLDTVKAELIKANGGGSSSTTATSSSEGGSCYPHTNGGKCYSPGEYCRASDHGTNGIDGAGDPITCQENNGWRWERA
ncbi:MULTISPECIES: hypothetical protein [Kitasatospora]|nr:MULTISPECIES: hypothetical protein [Kitasatospora]